MDNTQYSLICALYALLMISINVTSDGDGDKYTVGGHIKCLELEGKEIVTKDVTLCLKGGVIKYEYLNSNYAKEENLVDIRTQQEVSYKVLTALKLIDEDAIIAGGAPRNWDEGKLANDIDCYLRWNVNQTWRVLSLLSTLLGEEEGLKSTQDLSCGYHFGDDTFCIKKLVSFNYEGVLFQLILIHEIVAIADFKKAVVSHMDIGLNMVYCNWHSRVDIGRIFRTDKYTIDRTNKTLTLYQDVMNKEQLKHCMSVHLPKMVSYYPDYQIKLLRRNKWKIKSMLILVSGYVNLSYKTKKRIGLKRKSIVTDLTGEGGKGSSQRPYSVRREVFDLRHTLV